MLYTIVNQQKGRIRLRLGRLVLSKEKAEGLRNLLLAQPFVEKTEICYKNGSILVFYPDHCNKNHVLEYLTKLQPKDIPAEIISSETNMTQSKHDFEYNLVSLVSGHYLRKWLLPSWINPYYQWIKSLSFLKNGLISLFHGKIDVELLDATAIGVSLYRRDYTTASSTMFLLKLSDILFEYSKSRAKNQLAKSLEVNSSSVWRVNGDLEEQIPFDSVNVNDVLRLRKGTMIPVDGTILSGEALINESTMTGEPLSVHKKSGNTLFAGTIVEDGEVDILVKNLGSETRISKIVDFIQRGEENKAEIQGTAERLSDKIVPYSFGLFFSTWFLTRNLTRAVSILMVDFSCAIKLTTPIAVISALKEGAEAGIVVKGGKYLELLSKIDLVVFDKTGTLTKAVPQVSKILCLHPEYKESDILRHAACLEEHFPHSVANAIVLEAESRNLSHPELHEKVEYIVAHGIVTNKDGVRSCIGSYHFIFEDEGIPYPIDKKSWIDQEIGAFSPVYLAIGGELVGIICIFDPPRPEAKEVITELRKLGIPEIVMITGDNENTASRMAESLDLDHFVASVLPQGKAELISQYKNQGKTVLMVGDGINDAPALSTADVSATFAGSSDIAREIADISILSNDLRDLLKAHKLSTTLMQRISHQYAMIVGFNGSLLTLGAFGVLSAAQNALLHNLSTLCFAALSTKPLLEGGNTNETA